MNIQRHTLSDARGLSAPHALTALADRLRRLSPSHRDPERFHADKSEIERELRRLARKVK